MKLKLFDLKEKKKLLRKKQQGRLRVKGDTASANERSSKGDG